MAGFAIHFNPLSLQHGRHDGGVGDLEGIVKRPAGPDVFGRSGEAGRGAPLVGLNQMDLLIAHLKPRTGEIEPRPRDDPRRLVRPTDRPARPARRAGSRLGRRMTTTAQFLSYESQAVGCRTEHRSLRAAKHGSDAVC